MTREPSKAHVAVKSAAEATGTAYVAAVEWENDPWDSGPACTALEAARIAWRDAQAAWGATMERRGY